MTPSGYAFFDERTLPVFRAIAATVLPADALGAGADDERFLRGTDRALAGRSPDDQKLLRTFLKAVELLPVLRFGRRFSRLDPARRARVLTFLERGPVAKLRAGTFGVRTFTLLGYYGSTDTFAELRYPGPRLDAPYYQQPTTTAGGSAR